MPVLVYEKCPECGEIVKGGLSPYGCPFCGHRPCSKTNRYEGRLFKDPVPQLKVIS